MMKSFVVVLFLCAIPALLFADSHVDLIHTVPINPDPMVPFFVYLEASLPDQCWTQGPVGDFEFTDLDSFSGTSCPGGILYFWIAFDHDGLPEGQHSITVTEWHDSVRDPGPYEHVVEFTVGTPPVSNESISWSSVKALYR